MKRRAAPAFTLLEVMVALTITGLCVAIVAMSFSSVFQAHNRALEHMELQQTMNESLERIRILLQSAYLSREYPNVFLTKFETMDTDNLSEPYDALTFNTLAYSSHKINGKEADLIEVTLFTEEEPPLETAAEKLRLRRLRVRAGGDINTRFEVEGGTVFTLARHVTEFHLDYLNPFGEWKPEWIPADNVTEGAGDLPCAIRVTLALRSVNIAEHKASIMVPIEMSRGQCVFEDEKVFEND